MGVLEPSGVNNSAQKIRKIIKCQVHTQPSSSGRSAELLNNAVRIDPGLVTTSSGKVLPVLFPTLAAPLDAGLNPDFSLCLKKLNKKDPITKTKALQELCDLVKNGSVEDVVAALPSWAHYYRTLTTDTDHKVREAAQVAHGAVVAACGRRSAPQLKQLVPPWLQAQYDEYAPAAAAARASLKNTFPENKLPDVISFCMNEVIAHLLENLTGNAEATLSKRIMAPEEKELQLARLVTASLQGLEFFAQHLPRAHDAWLWAQLAPLLQAPGFWRHAASQAQHVRAAWYGALGRIIARFADTFGAAYGQKTARLLLAGGGGAQHWGCLLVLMHHAQDFHTWLDKKDLLAKRIIDVLENGGWGDAKHLSSMLLPLLANLPEHLLTKEFYESFFNAVFTGLEIKGVISSKSERQSWITSLSECLRYLTIQKNDYVVELATAVHRTWLEKILSNAHDSQTTNNLIRHSAVNMAALVKYWLKQSNETNDDKYDQLVRNFWQNVGSTTVVQIDKLSTNQTDITRLMEGHILLLQSLKTSLLQSTKKVKSIKFEDEEVKVDDNTESLQQCDPSTMDRYNHNLNEVVHKVCAHYFEFASKKQVANFVFTPLLTLLIEFDDKILFHALARHFDADSVFSLYDKVLRDWLAGDTMRCKSVADVVFLLLRHLTEKEQEAVLDSFKQFPPSVVEWCISLSLSHPHCQLPAVRRWLRGDLVEGSLVAVCKRMINDDDSKSRSLLLMCLANDERGELMISSSSVSRIVSLVSSALDASTAPERLAGAAVALCSELSGAADTAELARALYSLQLRTPRGCARLRPETWLELRGAWQEAGARHAAFRAHAVEAAHERLKGPELDIENIWHVVSLCPYLLAAFDEARLPAARDAVPLARALLSLAPAPARLAAAALRHDVTHAHLNCPFGDDNDFVRLVVEESSRSDVTELTKEDAVLFVTDVLFRASFLKTLALHRDEEETAWCGELFEEPYFLEEFAKVLCDFAVLCSLYEGYAYWAHYDVISRGKQHAATAVDDVVAEMPAPARASLLALLAQRAATDGFYWSYAKRRFQDQVRGAAAEREDAAAAGGAGDGGLEEIVTGNGFFHTLQADTRSSADRGAALRARHLLMLRSFFVAHAQSDVVDATFARAAAAGRAACDPDAVIDAYYRHQHVMLYESDIASADWRQVVSNAAIVDFLTEMVDGAGWEAPAPRWDFATITLCSLAAALHTSVQDWGCPKMALLARSVLALFRAVQRFAGAVRGESLRRQPAPHVAELPTEWRDIFAPDLTYNLFSIVLKVLAASGPSCTQPQAAFVAALLPTVARLDWHQLGGARRAELSVARLLAAGCRALAAPAHHAYKYLAHALLGAVAKPLVIHDAETLAVWTEDSANDDEDAPRVQLALAGLQPALTQLQELVDMTLHTLKVGEETCEMVPFTDSHSVTLGYLLLADATFSICQLARGDLVHHYLELFREPKHAEFLITSALRLLPAEVAAAANDAGSPPLPPQYAPMFLTAPQLTLDEPCTALVVGRLSCRALRQAARWAGGAARGWWGAAGGRAARALERLLRAYVSPALIREQLAAVGAGADDLEDAEVTIHHSTNEVTCVFRVEDRPLELSVALGAAHPLPLPRVAAHSAPAHNTHWLAVYLAYQNGTVLNALRMWMDTVARRVEAAPQCYICYCRLHPTTGRLPKVPCHQCRNKFHAHCLRKWFASSSKSNCPLCRATF